MSSPAMSARGYLLLYVPKSTADAVIADDLLRQAIRQTAELLYIAIAGRHADEDGDVVRYIAELYPQAWNDALEFGNPALETRIYPAKGSPASAEDLQGPSDADAIYCTASNGLLDVSDDRVSKRIALRSALPAPLPGNCYFFEDGGLRPKQYDEVVMGGTFDHLHNGHRKLLLLAAMVCRAELLVGITSTELLKKKRNPESLQDYATREKGVRDFVGSLYPELKLNCVEINDPYGPAIIGAGYKAIVCSSETIAGALKINEIRRERGLGELDVLITRRTQSYILSSTFIRNLGSISS